MIKAKTTFHNMTMNTDIWLNTKSIKKINCSQKHTTIRFIPSQYQPWELTLKAAIPYYPYFQILEEHLIKKCSTTTHITETKY